MRSLIRLILVLTLCHVTLLQAELRKPTPEEQKVLDKYTTVINAVLDRFRSDDWDENADFAVDENVFVSTKSGEPLDVDEMFQRTYNARYGSQRFNAKLQPLMQRLEQTQDINEKGKIGAEMQKFMHVQVQVHFNVANFTDIDPPPSQNHDLQIPGATFAYKINNNVTNASTPGYLLAFGPRKSLKWDAAQHWYRFTFAHPPNTPYIENIEVRIYGAQDRIEELLHTVDWKQLNQAITP